MRITCTYYYDFVAAHTPNRRKLIIYHALRVFLARVWRPQYTKSWVVMNCNFVGVVVAPALVNVW